MASFLVRAMAWRDGEDGQQADNPDEGQQPEETIIVTGRDYSLRLQASYDETAQRATVSWQPSTDKPVYVTSFSMRIGTLDYLDGWIPTIIHELGHVYTDSSLASSNPGSVGIGYLYLHLLTSNNTGVGPAYFCGDDELYADLAQIVFSGNEFVSPALGTLEGDGAYWIGCGLQLRQADHDQALQDIPEISRSVFIEQDMPDWLYSNYQLPGGDLDLEALWADIHSRREYGLTRQLISYYLRYEFGGYCSPEQVQQFIDGQIAELRNPWRDGGCDE